MTIPFGHSATCCASAARGEEVASVASSLTLEMQTESGHGQTPANWKGVRGTKRGNGELDLQGLAQKCFENDVSGHDLLDLHLQSAVDDLRLSSFQAKKLLGARAAFLAGEAGDGRHGR